MARVCAHKAMSLLRQPNYLAPIVLTADMVCPNETGHHYRRYGG